MTNPHNLGDLYLAPVALRVDAELARLGALSADDLLFELVVDTNREPIAPADRQRLLIEHLTQTLELHGWQLAWDERGLVVSHGDNDLTLGISNVMRDYLAGRAA
jgi:hypothetical protein